MMEIRRRLMQKANENNVYVWNLIPAYISNNTTYNIVSASFNNARIGFFGIGKQAGIYKIYSSSNNVTYVQPVIKMPNNTASITISFDTVSRLYNDKDVFVVWTKDISAGGNYSNYAYYLQSEFYNARENNGALKVNTLSVPTDADSFVGFFRVYPVIGENETAESIANDMGFSITFNKS